MRKKITARYAGKCTVCKEAIPAGSLAYWFGKGSGMSHLHCNSAKPDVADTPSIPNAEGDVSEFFVPLMQLREIYNQVINGDYSYFTKNRHRAEELVQMWRNQSSWIGCTIPDMQNWLENGYAVEGLQGIDMSLIPGKPRKRYKLDEEGDELLLDLAWSGASEHFLNVEKVNRKPGLNVEIDTAFSTMVSGAVIAKYASWFARAIHTLEEARVNVTVDIVNPSIGKFTMKRGMKSRTGVRVKEAGEAHDFASWSAFISPGGYRQLLWLANNVHGENHGLEVNSSYGQPNAGHDWQVAYDEGTNTLRISNPVSAKDFPEFDMTQKLAAVIEKIAG